jgi:endo-1,4-beta-xylanase
MNEKLQEAAMDTGLKDAWKNSFKIGAAVSERTLREAGADSIVRRHISSLTCENAMKFGPVHPEEHRWAWGEADIVASYARSLGIPMRGHTIVWHNQTPDWLFKEGPSPGADSVSKAALYRRLEQHIEALTSRYNDVVYAWDVLNEVIEVDKENDRGFRLSPWYTIGGSEVYTLAFKLMRQASPGKKLFYNDFNNEGGKKMETIITFLRNLLDAGVPLDGVGVQGHWRWDYPDVETLRSCFRAYSELGLEIEITELDISAYGPGEGQKPEEYFTSMPEERLAGLNDRYREIYRTAAEFPAVKNITTWGIADNYTWLDSFPLRDGGRKNWPLLFDTEFRPKAAVGDLIRLGNS